MNKSSINTRTKVGYIYIAFIHLLLVVMLWKSNFIEKIESKLGFSSPILSFHERMVDYHQTMDGSIPEGAVLFIGDSITQALATSAITDRSVNLGIGSDTTRGVTKRLPLYKSIARAEVVVLSIGVNDIHHGVDHEEILTNYKEILEFISPDVSIVAASVLPIGLVIEKKGFTNADILSLNTDIKKLTQEYDNVAYLDNNTALQNDNGYLRQEFHIGDGVHLSDEGYAILIESFTDFLPDIVAN